MALSKTAYVILGMLRLGRRTGYDIKALVDVSTRFFWAASYGQIYPELKRLEEMGLVQGEAEAQGGRQRRAYSLTPEGEQALRSWIASGAPLHFELRHEGMLRFFFADAATLEEQVDLLRTIRADHARVRDQLRSMHPGPQAAEEEGGKRFTLRTLEFGIAYNEFIVDWTESLEQELTRTPAAVRG